MDDNCTEATDHFDDATHDFSHSVGAIIDHTEDSSWGQVAETGINAGSAWYQMEKACDNHTTDAPQESGSSDTPWYKL